jgi:hypothetical protein
MVNGQDFTIDYSPCTTHFLQLILLLLLAYFTQPANDHLV